MYTALGLHPTFCTVKQNLSHNCCRHFLVKTLCPKQARWGAPQIPQQRDTNGWSTESISLSRGSETPIVLQYKFKVHRHVNWMRIAILFQDIVVVGASELTFWSQRPEHRWNRTSVANFWIAHIESTFDNPHPHF